MGYVNYATQPEELNKTQLSLCKYHICRSQSHHQSDYCQCHMESGLR